MDPKCTALKQSLLNAPDYSKIPDRERISCRKFLALIDDPETSELEMEALYEDAEEEARLLANKGELTITLQPASPSPMFSADSNHSETTEYPVHPVAKMFPMMSEDDLDLMAADIKINGLKAPIILDNGKIVDGRNRLEACKRVGVTPSFMEWSGEGNVVDWIFSVNLHRRHLTDRQRAIVASQFAKAFATERQSWERKQEIIQGRSADNAARLLNVSVDSVKKASKIIETADEQLVQLVREDKISLDAAAQLSTLPKKQQRILIEKGQVKSAAKRVRKGNAAIKATQKIHGGHEDNSPSLPIQVENTPLPVENLSATSGEKPIEKISLTYKFLPLAHEVCEAIDEMILSSEMGPFSDKVNDVLEKIIELCEKATAEFENKSILKS